MSLVAYADSDEDSSDNELSEGVLPSVGGQEHDGNNEDRVEESVPLAGPAVLGQ